MGAADPTSGTVSLHEVVRGLGALYKRGWKPLRTIVIASWDAEEVSAISHYQQFSLSVTVRSRWKH
jgi:N-acetylated-alpha-linked acidic dipeptidase